MTDLERYKERLRKMGDAELKKEWKSLQLGELRKERESPQTSQPTETVCLTAAEHEMAVRFLWRQEPPLSGRDEGQYFLRKYMELPDRFWKAYCKAEWPRAKMIYDDAIRIGLFLEVPEEVRAQVMGSRQDPERPVEGMFPERAVNRVMHECVVRNRLGHECVVYRVPGEIGFYGARHLSGTRWMEAEENPAYYAAGLS